MHLWRITFRVGDFGAKQLTLTTAERAADLPNADGTPVGGFAEVEHKALLASQQETSGWPNPIEMLSIEYLDEIDGPTPPAAKPKAKK